MKDVMGVINLGNEHESLKELTYFRNQASVPFGGRYRLIDFALSNMANSGIQDVAVLGFNKNRSLIEHLGTGRDWDLNRKQGGLFILPHSYNLPFSNYLGDLQNFYQHLDFFIRGNQKYVIISNGNIVSNLDYRPAFHYHKQLGADITVLYKKIETDNEDYSHWRKIDIDDDGELLAMEDNKIPLNTNTVSMETFIMKKDLVLSMIDSCENKGKCDLVLDGIINNIGNLKIFGFNYQGFVANINSISSYYKHSMELLNNDEWRNLFYQPRSIYTKTKNDPPAKFMDNSNVKNSIIANGCIIDGKVENSIIFRGVKVRKGAFIKNSIIMQMSEIGENAIINNSILDKKVSITKEKVLNGEIHNPYVVEKKMTI